MTATTIPQGLSSRSWNTLLKVTAIVALIVVLTAGAFAFGRSTADDGAAAATPSHASSGASTYQDPALDLPPVSLHTGVQHFYVEADAASCNHTANTPPC